MSKKRELNGSIIEAMRKAGWLRNDAYTLKDGFTGNYEVESVIPRKTRDAEDYNNFAVQVSGSSKVTIPGSVIANARVLSSDEVSGTAIKGATGVFYRDDIPEAMNGSTVFHEAVGMNDDDFPFPESFKIVGAVVDKDDSADHPRIPLRRYKYYQQVLDHHRAITGEADAFITRDLFKEYLNKPLSEKPKGVPESAKELELLDSVKADEMSNWSFTLLLADVNE